MDHTRVPSESLLLLREAVNRNNAELVDKLESLGEVPLSMQDREALREAVSDEIARSGVDEQGRLDARGMALDNLIDLLGHL